MHNQQPWAGESGKPCLVTYNPRSKIDEDKVIGRWWFQHIVHDVRHVALLTHLFRFIQGRRRTWHCGAHTLFNGQETCFVSGLAAGVDAAAHKAAIDQGGRTVAVLGTPLDTYYPTANKALQQRIMAEHAAVSQFPSGYPATPKNFPMRNRTMALLSDATVIVEAGEKSGTRHQGWEALRLGRLVFIMANIVERKNLGWVKEMLGYGADVLSRDNLCSMIENLPAFTNRDAFAFQD